MNKSIVLQRQSPLRAAYQQQPERALIRKQARTAWARGIDPFHGQVTPGEEAYGVRWPYGIDRAIGGFHDAPNPAEMICAALAACTDATVRMVADLLGVALERVDVEVSGTVDVRGTLAMDRDTPVGFRSLHCRVTLETAAGTRPELVQRLQHLAERSCITLQTLRAGVPVELACDVATAQPA